MVYGEVMRIHVDDKVVTSDGKLDIPRIRPLARLGYYDYTSVTETFEMRIPSDNPATLVGAGGQIGLRDCAAFGVVKGASLR